MGDPVYKKRTTSDVWLSRRQPVLPLPSAPTESTSDIALKHHYTIETTVA